MRRRAANAGMTLVELLVGMGLGLVGAALLVGGALLLMRR